LPSPCAPMVRLHLEEYGFCDIGTAKDLVAEGNLEVTGRLPVNTHGGQLGEAYIHGVNGIAEGVRLIRGTSTNQPPKPINRVLVTGGSPVPHSGLILSRDRCGGPRAGGRACGRQDSRARGGRR